MQISDMHLSVAGQAVLAAKPHMFSSWLKIAWSCRLFFQIGERNWGKEKEEPRAKEDRESENEMGGREIEWVHMAINSFPFGQIPVIAHSVFLNSLFY